MDDHDRRVHAALVNIAQLGAENMTLGLLELHRFHQQARERRGGHISVSRA
jgi:hypothetical protein